jgi:hypothetical protein
LLFTRAVLSTGDLNTLSKKAVRRQLEARYGAELGNKTTFVNQEIEAAAMGY